MTRFSVTWDYRCPFARNAHEHVLDALAGGAGWNVSFVPFSLGQVHVEEGQPDVWERPTEDSGLLALQIGVVVRDQHPELFPAVHRALFALRHDHGRHLWDEGELTQVVRDHGLDAEAVLAEVTTGRPLTTVRDQHTQAAKEHNVWGVPTFIQGDLAAFVRLMDRPDGDSDYARRSIERILDLLNGAPDLNEFKHTSLDH